MKIIKIVATRCHILRLKCTELNFGWGSPQLFHANKGVGGGSHDWTRWRSTVNVTMMMLMIMYPINVVYFSKVDDGGVLISVKTLKCYRRRYSSYIAVVPDRIDDSNVALQCREKNTVGRCTQKNPQRGSCQPHTTHELVIDAVTWHTSAVHFDHSDQQREERRTHVYDALVDDQNVYRLNTNIVLNVYRHRLTALPWLDGGAS